MGNAEAQWVISVLNECVTNMNILSSLTPEIMVEPLFRQLDPELILTFQDHFAIEKEYVSVEERLSERPSASDERRLLNLDAQYADSTRTICRVLKVDLPLPHLLFSHTQHALFLFYPENSR